MHIKRLVSGICIFMFLAWMALSFRDSLSYQRLAEKTSGLINSIKVKLGIIKYNIAEDVNPQRKRPLSTILHEEKLIQFLPNVFGEFSREQWQDFWELIYGHKETGEGFIKQKTYRSQEEIEDYLKYHYPDPFEYFKGQHWNYFWEIVFSK